MVFGLALVVSSQFVPEAAHAFSLASSGGDDPYPLHWEPEGAITFEQHYLGGGGLPSALLQGASRSAMVSWAELPDSDVAFEEQVVGQGRPCPHGLPASHADRADEICGGPVEEVDGQSTLFFMESVWPFSAEAIALTTVSFAAEGQIVDADISFNAVDYDWTVGTGNVRTDYQSIALHEVGHLLGLDHSEVPGAAMVLDYDQGSLARELSDDDAEGMASLYPCNAPACRGAVDYVSSGCSMAGPALAGFPRHCLWLFVLFAALLRVSRRSRVRRPAPAAAGFPRRPCCLLLAATTLVASGWLASPANASTVVLLSVDEITDRSDLVVRGTVVDLSSFRDGIVWTRVVVEVASCWRGDCEEFVELVQPGGQVDGFGTRAFGMPTFVQGDEVVLFLASSSVGALQVVGLTQGSFQVADDGKVARDLGAVKRIRIPSEDRVGTQAGPGPDAPPRTVQDLFRRVTGR